VQYTHTPTASVRLLYDSCFSYESYHFFTDMHNSIYHGEYFFFIFNYILPDYTRIIWHLRPESSAHNKNIYNYNINNNNNTSHLTSTSKFEHATTTCCSAMQTDLVIASVYVADGRINLYIIVEYYNYYHHHHRRHHHHNYY